MGRIKWVDIAKGTGMLFVLLGHYILATDGILFAIKSIIYTFHMPLFFICSGYLLDEKNTNFKMGSAFLRKRVYSLLIPYLTFSVLNITFEMMINVVKGEPINFVNRMLGIVIQVRGTNLSGTCWFLTWMFVVQVLVVIIFSYLHNSYLQDIVVVGCFVVGAVLEAYGLRLPWHVDAALVAVLFFRVGMIFRKQGEKFVNVVDFGKIAKIGAIILFCISYYYNTKVLNGKNIDLFECRVGNPFLYVLLGILGSIGVIFISKKIQETKIGIVLSTIGQYSLAIYGFHRITGTILYQVEKVVRLTDGGIGVESLRLLISLVLSTILCVMLAKFVEKKVPILFGFKKCAGNRLQHS